MRTISESTASVFCILSWLALLMKEKGMLPSTSSWGNAISRQTLRELGNHSLESGKCRNRYLTQARKVKDERLPLPGGIWKSHSYIRDSLHFQSLMEQRKTPWISQGPWVDLQENTSLGSIRVFLLLLLASVIVWLWPSPPFMATPARWPLQDSWTLGTWSLALVPSGCLVVTAFC